MSLATLERETIAYGTDLASLVIAYHRRAHTVPLAVCAEQMCRVAQQVADLAAMYEADA